MLTTRELPWPCYVYSRTDSHRVRLRRGPGPELGRGDPEDSAEQEEGAAKAEVGLGFQVEAELGRLVRQQLAEQLQDVGVVGCKPEVEQKGLNTLTLPRPT